MGVEEYLLGGVPELYVQLALGLQLGEEFVYQEGLAGDGPCLLAGGLAAGTRRAG